MSNKVCPICGSHRLWETIYGAIVLRLLRNISEEDWDIKDEEINCDEASFRYGCGQCDHEYKATDFYEVVKEMVSEEEYAYLQGKRDANIQNTVEK